MQNYVQIIGWLLTFVCFALLISGAASYTMMRFVKNDWRTKHVQGFRHFHKWFGYSIILVVQIPMIDGFMAYYRVLGIPYNNPQMIGMLFGNFLIWTVGIVSGEIYLWRKHSSTVKFKKVDKYMNRSEFEEAI